MSSKSKIVKRPTLVKHIKGLKAKGHTIAFTNGCFDLVHFGHVSYLEKAKGKDRVLVVGLNSDDSIRRLKGKTRPVVSEIGRARLLAALSCVDYVCIFDEDTPYNLIKAVDPDVLIKGADWKGKDVVGSDVVKANGGRVQLIKYEQGFSTSNIIDKILRTS